MEIKNQKRCQSRQLETPDVLSQPLSPMFALPDANLIGRDCNYSEIGRLLQLVLGCAVNCENKQEHIEVIMRLEEDVQHGVMQAIQELMMSGGREREGSISMTFPDSLNVEQPSVVKEQLRRVQDELMAANEAKELAIQKCFELEKALSILREEKESLASENDRLIQNLNENRRSGNRAIDDITDESLRDRHLSKLQARIDTLQEDLIKIETIKDEYRVKIELLEKELMETRLENEELQRKAKEARHLKDELDIHKHLSDKAEKYEQTIETYKKKLEEMADVKRQLKLLQEKNKEQLKSNLELEEEKKKSSNLKAQLDVYKKQLQDLQEQLVEHRHRADKIEFEFRRLEEKHDLLVQETERIKREKVQLKLELDETRKRPSSFTEDSMPAIATEMCLNNEIMPQDFKESYNRVQQENIILRNRLEEKQSEANLIEQLKMKINELEIENKLANKRADHLQIQLDNIHLPPSEEAHTNRVIELQDAIKQIETLTLQLKEAEEKIAHLEMDALKKNEEMSEMGAKYKKYVSKAKQAVKALEPISLQGSPGVSSVPFVSAPLGTSIDYSEDIEVLKSLLQEKDRIINELEEEAEKSRALMEMEERLITVAVHNLAGSLQRRSAGERISSRSASMSQTNSGSFLSRQRLATTRRFNTSAISQKMLGDGLRHS
ncbi:protein Hook 3-like protein [Dinothrombium tinctorium]|uniref:Protein Hook 3-like protein n=1 Tax=Dinothrombium tinctorium TaxID=1965070 RepID=A0A3S3S5V8_9ACAR|nr:protein Hook 3-like protein [Dinothrombium tinctorium]